ncbi:DUF4265 domain-containing protein [Streptomyces sp. NPDC056390]|uniref:DUF4265 domain-containing protein n=1 Tax=Streptomyces sp. NPDC056390 TaxID=3345806 RepID=UPI0035DB2AF4
MTSTSIPLADTHVRLLAGHASSGKPVFEVLPARSLDSGLFELAGSPGLALGCAAGDVLCVSDDGQFDIRQVGRNFCVQAAPQNGPFTSAALAELTEEFEAIGGLVESPSDRRFIVVTVDRSVGLPAIADVMEAWSLGVGQGEWWFGNADEPQ